jgi:hypothetical protein
MDELLDRIEIQSRLKYLTDPKAKKLWEFLSRYVQEHFDFDNSHCALLIPAYRVLDALSMINQEEIRYGTSSTSPTS